LLPYRLPALPLAPLEPDVLLEPDAPLEAEPLPGD
jgi:hypothetical protein